MATACPPGKTGPPPRLSGPVSSAQGERVPVSQDELVFTEFTVLTRTATQQQLSANDKHSLTGNI